MFAYYTGGGGIPVSGLWRRLLFSFFYRDINLLVTDNIVDKSRILIRRNISDRIARIAPFLNQDHDPYMVIQTAGWSGSSTATRSAITIPIRSAMPTGSTTSATRSKW